MHFHCLPSWLQRRLRDVGFEPRGLGREALDVRDEAVDLLVRDVDLLQTAKLQAPESAVLQISEHAGSLRK